MTEGVHKLSDFTTLMNLDPLPDGRFRSSENEPNQNERVYGGQLMGQVISAAIRTVAPARLPTMLQMTFLADTRPARPIDYTVSVVQDGKSFSSRQVMGRQGDTGLVVANVSFQTPITEARHQVSLSEPAGSPDAGRRPEDLPPDLANLLGLVGFDDNQAYPNIEYRFVAPDQELAPKSSGTKIRFWMRITQALPIDPAIHAIGLAYLSDWWLNYASLAPHLDMARGNGVYVASLNHSLWFHTPCRVDEWLLCVIESPWANSARGLSISHIYRQDGLLVALATQESLQIPRLSPTAR